MNDPTQSIIDIYDTIADDFAKRYAGDLSDNPLIDSFLSKLPPNARILDLGCGAGQTVNYMTKKGFQVTGIDLSKKMLAIAKKNYPNCSFKMMDMQHIEFPQESFDGILSSYSLIHVPDACILEVLLNYYRILKKDGWIAIFGQQGEPDHYIQTKIPPNTLTFFNFFTPERITQKLKQAGFSIISIDSIPSDEPSFNMSDTNLYILAKK